MEAAPLNDQAKRPAWGKLGLILLIALSLAALWRFTPVSELLSAERISAWASAVRGIVWAPAVVIAAYTPAAFIMFPRPLLTVLTVIAFGPWLGFVYAMSGIMLAALVTYYAGRFVPAETVRRLGGEKAERARKVLRSHGLAAVFAVRIVPVAPFALEGIIAGAIPVKLWHFALGTFAGMVPGVLAETVFGHQLAAALDDPSNINYAALAAVVAAFLVIAFFARRWFKKQGF